MVCCFEFESAKNRRLCGISDILVAVKSPENQVHLTIYRQIMPLVVIEPEICDVLRRT